MAEHHATLFRAGGRTRGELRSLGKSLRQKTPRRSHRGLDRNVNRLVYAALAAALFSGAARLWANGVAPKVRGVSIPGAVGTLAAGAFAMRLLRASKRAGGIG